MDEPPIVKDMMIEDMAILCRWVRSELFDNVKFLYNMEIDLRGDGALYNMFLFHCLGKLVGVKNYQGEENIEYRKLYVSSLWSEATKKKYNVIADGLASRRSSIYSAMSNRFKDFSNLCMNEKAILPSIEAFEMGIEIPSVYFVFYEYFFKSSVGDAKWKKACLEADAVTDPLGMMQGEAFAMLMLKNNYFAWLWEAKSEMKDLLITDYDTDAARNGKATVSEAFLKAEINLDVAILVLPLANNNDREAGVDYNQLLVLQDDHGVLYQTLKKNTEAAMKEVRLKANANEKYKELETQMKEYYDDTPQEEGQQEKNAHSEPENDADTTRTGAVISTTTSTMSLDEEKQQRRTKKRKLLRSFREYTNPNHNEGQFKGWSTRAATEMKDLCAKLRRDPIEKKQLFWAAYRQTYQNKQESAGKKKKKVVLEPVDLNYVQDIWNIGGIPRVHV